MTDHLSRDSRTFLTKTLAALTIVIGATGAQAQAAPVRLNDDTVQ